MTTRYKLPDWLGGYEVNRLTDAATPGRVNVTLSRGEGLIIEIDLKDLTEVTPPLPPVPDAPAVSVGDLVWCRDDIEGEGPVFLQPGGRPTLNWAELNERAAKWGKPIIPLVPDPAADAPELPFKIWTSGERSVIAEPSDAYADRLFVEVDSAHLVRKHVRQLAAAMWAWAAREVETP